MIIMGVTSFKTVDEYIAGQAETTQAALAHVQSAIRKALPNADGVIS